VTPAPRINPVHVAAGNAPIDLDAIYQEHNELSFVAGDHFSPVLKFFGIRKARELGVPEPEKSLLIRLPRGLDFKKLTDADIVLARIMEAVEGNPGLLLKQIEFTRADGAEIDFGGPGRRWLRLVLETYLTWAIDADLPTPFFKDPGSDVFTKERVKQRYICLGVLLGIMMLTNSPAPIGTILSVEVIKRIVLGPAAISTMDLRAAGTYAAKQLEFVLQPTPDFNEDQLGGIAFFDMIGFTKGRPESSFEVMCLCTLVFVLFVGVLDKEPLPTRR
jgi:hypothetical protein